MFTMWAVLVYVSAVGIPLYLLHTFHSQEWYWHVLAVCASIGIGIAPIPINYQSAGFDLLLGFLFVSFLFWGAGGLISYHPAGHHHRHA